MSRAFLRGQVESAVDDAPQGLPAFDVYGRLLSEELVGWL